MRSRSFALKMLALSLFLVIASSAAFCTNGPTPVCKPKVFSELLSIPVRFAVNQDALITLSILPCDICQTDQIDGSGGAPGITSVPPVIEKTVHVLLVLRKADGTPLHEFDGDFTVGQFARLLVAFDRNDFGGDDNAEIIATACVTESTGVTWKKKASCCAILSGSLQIIEAADDSYSGSTLTPLLPIGTFPTIKF